MISVLFLLESHLSSLIMGKKSDKSQLKNVLQNTWLAPLKPVKITKNKESLRNCHSQEKPKQTWQQNVMWYLQWALRKEKRIGKNKGKLNKVGLEFKTRYQCLLIIMTNVPYGYKMLITEGPGSDYRETLWTLFMSFL